MLVTYKVTAFTYLNFRYDKDNRKLDEMSCHNMWNIFSAHY